MGAGGCSSTRHRALNALGGGSSRRETGRSSLGARKGLSFSSCGGRSERRLPCCLGSRIWRWRTLSSRTGRAAGPSACVGRRSRSGGVCQRWGGRFRGFALRGGRHSVLFNRTLVKKKGQKKYSFKVFKMYIYSLQKSKTHRLVPEKFQLLSTLPPACFILCTGLGLRGERHVWRRM